MSPGTSSVLWTDTPPSQGQEMGRDELRRKGLSWLEAQSQGAPPRTRGSVVPNVGSTHPCSSSGRLCQSASSALHTSVPAPRTSGLSFCRLAWREACAQGRRRSEANES